ncbi:MAG: YMGG-like glycine zipper-containing protein [Candidatus Acidiferrum sp.]
MISKCAAAAAILFALLVSVSALPAVVGRTAYPLLTGDYQVKGSSSGKRSAKRVVGGAGLGAVIGGIAGNAGKGAAIGATAGAVGSVVQKGKSVNVPTETLLEFRLQQPASLPTR